MAAARRRSYRKKSKRKVTKSRRKVRRTKRKSSKKRGYGRKSGGKLIKRYVNWFGNKKLVYLKPDGSLYKISGRRTPRQRRVDLSNWKLLYGKSRRKRSRSNSVINQFLRSYVPSQGTKRKAEEDTFEYWTTRPDEKMQAEEGYWEI